MDPAIVRGLLDRQYEVRKKAALQLEKQIKFIFYEEHGINKLNNIINQLCGTKKSSFSNEDKITENNEDNFIGEASNLKNGDNELDINNANINLSSNGTSEPAEIYDNNDIFEGITDIATIRIAKLMAYASIIISLGQTNSLQFANKIVYAMLPFFYDPNDLVRFYSCESLYNIAKILKGEILKYFNEIFDILCLVTVDPINNVRGAASILDRLMKDIVIEFGSDYSTLITLDDNISMSTIVQTKKANINSTQIPENIKYKDISEQHQIKHDDERPHILGFDFYQPSNQKLKQSASSTIRMDKFVPILLERIYSNNNNTKVFLMSWIEVLNKCPNLTLVTYLPWLINAILLYLDDIGESKEITEVATTLLDGMLKEVCELGTVRTKLCVNDKASVVSKDITTHKGNLISNNQYSEKLSSSFLKPQANKKNYSLNSNSKRISSVDSWNSSSSNTNNRYHKVSGGSMTIKDRKKSLIINNMNIDDIEDDSDEAPAPPDSQSVPTNDSVADGEEYIPRPYLDIKKLVHTLIKSLSSSNPQIQKVVLQWLTEIIQYWPVTDIIDSKVIKTQDDGYNTSQTDSESAPVESNDKDVADLISLLLKLGDISVRNNQQGFKKNLLYEGNNLNMSLSDNIGYIDNTVKKPEMAPLSKNTDSSSVKNTGANSILSSKDIKGLSSVNMIEAKIVSIAYKLNFKVLETLTISQQLLLERGRTLKIPTTSLINSLALTFKESCYESRILILNWLIFVYKFFITSENCELFNDNCFLILIKAMTMEDDRDLYYGLQSNLVSNSNIESSNNSIVGKSTSNVYGNLIMDEEDQEMNFDKIISNMDDLKIKGTDNTKALKLVSKSLTLLKMINALDPSDSYFNKFLNMLLDNWQSQFYDNLSDRRESIFVTMCVTLGYEKLYKNLSILLDSRFKANSNGYKFITEIINMMAKKMIASKEFYPLRKKLKMNDDWTFFSNLFKAWCIQPSALIYLCLISENYELGYNIILGFVNLEELLPKNLMQIDILVQLLESQPMTQVRLDLLCPDKQYLIKLLYSILMLLPQSSSAFKLLNQRLSSIEQYKNVTNNGLSSLSSPVSSARSSSTSSGKSIMNSNSFQFSDLLEYYHSVIDNI
ncbi:hypothetical protein ACO0R3_001731 [Hanseniaspora guilliermondii]